MRTVPRTFAYTALPYDAVMPAVIAAITAQHGDNDFIVSSAGDGVDERITYAEADAQSATLARRLLAAGVTKGVRIGILAPNGVHFAVAFLAATRIGAVAVPINTFFQASELAWLLRDADIHTVLAVDHLLGKDIRQRILDATHADLDVVEQLQLPGLPCLRNVLPLGDTDRRWPTAWPEPVPESFLRACEGAVRPSDDLVVIYTSGSTSNPKGVIHTHEPALVHSRFIAQQHDWTAADRVYVPMAFFWVGGLVFGMLGPMQMGATLLTEHRFDAGDVLRLLEVERATYATGFPHVGPALTNHPAFAGTDLSSLRDGYHPGLLAPERRAPDVSLRVTQLGMTETCSSHTWWPPHEAVPESKRGSLGVDAPGYEHKIVDENGAEVPDGVTGEICVRGYAMMRGMVGKHVAQIFDVDGWFHTKDAGYRDSDGHLYFAGRTDDMIKTSGANVAPVEVEAALTRVDGVRLAYVIGLPDPDKGALVSAVVVPNDGCVLSPDNLAAACKADLAAYKVPKKWIMLANPDALPYTSTNKIDKIRLAQLVADGALA